MEKALHLAVMEQAEEVGVAQLQLMLFLTQAGQEPLVKEMQEVLHHQVILLVVEVVAQAQLEVIPL